MLYTLQTVKDNLRNRDGKRVFYLGKGDQLTSQAKDFLNGERIEILPAAEAKKDRWQLLSGGFTEDKPEHMTHLNGDVLVPKTHPRIRFRGMMDTLEAELLWCCLQVQTDVQRQLEEILTFVRDLVRRDVLEEPVEQISLCGLRQQQLREHSHRPQDFYGQPHFMPSPKDGQAILAVNRARCIARAAELSAAEAFCDRDGNPTRPDILQALNRISSMLYLLMIRLKAQQQGEGSYGI